MAPEGNWLPRDKSNSDDLCAEGTITSEELMSHIWIAPASNVTDCPQGYARISEYSGCQQAATYLDLSEPDIGSSEGFPSGCYVWMDSADNVVASRHVFWNSHPDGYPQEDSLILCSGAHV